MYSSKDLYTVVVPPAEAMDGGVEPGVVLVHGLNGFMDAGGGGRLAIAHLLSTLPNRPVAYFHIDGLYDYRGRRPRTVFDSDHYESMELPHLTLSEVTDETGKPFLLLHGYEPDLGWQSVVRSVVEIIRTYGVRLTVGIHAIPWAAPHTRPIEITQHGTDPALLGENLPWVGQVEIPGSLSALIEINLRQASLPAMGFAAHVPHYVAQNDYPKAALALLDQIALSTGLVIPRDDLRERAVQVDREIDEQVRAHEENLAAIAGLEQQHDATVAQRRELPEMTSGDDLAKAFEQYLSELGDNES